MIFIRDEKINTDQRINLKKPTVYIYIYIHQWFILDDISHMN